MTGGIGYGATLGRQKMHNPSAEALEQRVHLAAGAELVGYLPDWEVSKLGDIDLGDLTRINYFSVAARADGSLAPTSASGYGLGQLRSVVAAAHAATPP